MANESNMKTGHRSIRTLGLSGLWILAMGGILSARAQGLKDLTFSGMGWVQYGHVGHSTDTAKNNYNGNPVQTTGAQISLHAAVSEKLVGAVGIGVYENHYLSGNANGGRIPFMESPYIAEANFTYSFWKSDASTLQLRGGLFTFDYDPDVKNLGSYLLRGPVHPGILLSGFETKLYGLETKGYLPIANTLGFQLHHETGKFRQDLILNSETDLYPYYDLSPAYLAGYQATPAFHVGAGVNFYRYLAIEPDLTSPHQLSPDGRDINPQGGYPYGRNYIYVDPVTQDTTFISFKGIKLMANAAFDPKSLLSSPSVFGAEDLKVYGEVALLGLEDSKAYNEIYGDYLHRMPVMLGFNLPAFTLLDNLSLEVEWYGAKFRDDLWRYQTGRSFYPSPLPVSTYDVVSTVNVEQNVNRDNWKWSLYGSRTIRKHFKLSFQAANDHFRPGGVVGNPSQEAILSTPKDWYWMTKIAYFF